MEKNSTQDRVLRAQKPIDFRMRKSSYHVKAKSDIEEVSRSEAAIDLVSSKNKVKDILDDHQMQLIVNKRVDKILQDEIKIDLTSLGNLKRLKFTKNTFGTILNPKTKGLSGRSNNDDTDDNNLNDEVLVSDSNNISQGSNKKDSKSRKLELRINNLSLPQNSHRENRSSRFHRPSSSNKVNTGIEQSTIEGVNAFFQNLERKYTNQIDKEQSKENFASKERKSNTNCPLDLNEWVRNSFNRHHHLKVVDSEYPFEMLYNPVFDKMEERFDTGETTRMKIIPVIVSIDEKYSRNPDMKNAARITMKILDGFETKEHFYYNGLPSRKGKIVISDPIPIDKESFETTKRDKLLKRTILKRKINRSSSNCIIKEVNQPFNLRDKLK